MGVLPIRGRNGCGGGAGAALRAQAAVVEGGGSVSLKWRAALSVASVYGYFLIFAQFSYVELLREADVGLGGEKAELGMMALAGVAAGFLFAGRGVQVRWMVMAFWFSKGDRNQETAVERGQQVYLEEGCFACHSRYVREGDPAGWGPPTEVASALREQPVTIGNRRQGPDLRNVGARRSEAWLREHFISPRAMVKGSAMPSCLHLFEDGRGEDLIAWLREDASDALVWRIEQAKEWMPEGKPSGDGSTLFSRHCAACHGANARGDGILAGKFGKPPADLVNGPFVWTTDRESVARVVKWGVTGTDMPGHELLDDGEVLALADWVLELRKQQQ